VDLLIDWRAVVAVILALGVTLTVVLLAVEELQHPGHVSPEEAELLALSIGVSVGAVAVYLGGRGNGGK
jgi:hypothetical protein